MLGEGGTVNVSSSSPSRISITHVLGALCYRMGRSCTTPRSLPIIPVKPIAVSTPEGLYLLKGSADPEIRQRSGKTQRRKPAFESWQSRSTGYLSMPAIA